MDRAASGRARWARRATVAVFVATVAQLLVATLASDLPQFASKGFAARLVAYPVLMLLAPAIWAVRSRHRDPRPAAPWAAFALLMAPFLVDVTGNSLDLYDTVGWWDDANHAVNWFLLSLGIGLLLRRGPAVPAWAVGVLVAGVGALLAIGWEVAEYFAFIRNGTELDTAYRDTLGDEVLGSLGACVAGAVVANGARGAAGE